jgi:phospholipid N-methyltransferase
MEYNKVKYWNKRTDPNNDGCRSYTPNHIAAVKPFIEKNQNILEYGPGTGRMVELYENQSHINFYDISDNYSSRLKTVCENKNLKIQNHIIDRRNKMFLNAGNIRTPFKDNEFDIVCAFEVLLHCPKDEIEAVIKELSRIGKKVIVITWYLGGEEKILRGGYTGNFKNIIKKNNLNLCWWDEDSFLSTSQVFFIYGK